MTGNPTFNWRLFAACRGMDPEIFFPERGDMAGFAAAVAVCDTCPVVNACLRHAIENRERDGIWGGKALRARRELARTDEFNLRPKRVRHGGHPIPQCGTEGGYRRHIRVTKTPTCDACREAHRRSNNPTDR